MCIISHLHKFVYIRTQKTGSSSLGCNFGELAVGPNDIVVPMRPLPQLEGRYRTTFLPRNYDQLRPWVARFGTPRAINHTFATDARAMLGEEAWKEYVTVSSVRNPFDAMLSEYFYIQDFLLHPLSYFLFCLSFTWLVLASWPSLLSVPPFVRFVALLYRACLRFEDLLFPLYWHTYLRFTDRFGAYGMGEPVTFLRDWICQEGDSQQLSQRRFGAFVQHLFAQYADKRQDFQHPNQHRMILDEHGEVVPLDFYIRFEHMQEDLDRVHRALGLPTVEVAWLKNGSRTRGRKRVHYSYYYDDVTRGLIEKENKALIERFGYQFTSL